MKHYIVRKAGEDYFIFNREKPETDKAKVDTFGLLKFTAQFARAGYLVSFVNENEEERVVCHQQSPTFDPSKK